MRLDDLTLELLEAAIAIYYEFSYPGHTRAMSGLEIPPEAGPEALLARFVDETKHTGKQTAKRFIMRLGNVNYPFMKLVFQEHLFPGEFCFMVDTHDDIEVPPNAPDYSSWVVLKEVNRRLKREIEAAWEQRGIPTQTMLQELAAIRGLQSDSGEGRVILVADDEEDLAQAMVTLLKARGYRARAVFDGRQALEEVRRDPPDLLVLDYEMPNLSGVEVIDLLQEEEQTASLPVLLVTGGPITLSEKYKAAGFLCKPFPEDLMVSVVRHLLGEDRGGSLAPSQAEQ